MNNQKKHYWLYILKLEQDKYYVGVTTKTPEIRIKEHISQVRPAKWTSKYQPIQLFDKKELGYVTKEEAENYENTVTLEYMKKYGLQNVRGGRVTTTERVFRVGKLFFSKEMLEGFVVVALLIICAMYIMFHR